MTVGVTPVVDVGVTPAVTVAWVAGEVAVAVMPGVDAAFTVLFATVDVVELLAKGL